MTLKELQIGKSAVVDTVGGSGALRQHFLDMGLIPGAEVTLVKLAPMGDPMELRIHGYELTLRLDDAAQIGITPTEKAPAISAAPADDKMVDHPGLGEGGKYHIKKGENPLPEGKTLTFALAGNQNCGKTTLFNQLTGSNQHVGNFPGVTVHRCIHGIIHLIEDHAKAAGIPVRFAATKLVEGDQRIEEALKLDQNEKEMIEHIIVQMEQERGLDRAAAIADMRFSFIQELVAKTVVKPHESKEQLRSNRIDKFLTGKYTAIPAFIAIMGLVFFLTFNVIGLFFQNLMETGINALTGIVDTALTNWNVNAAVHSLLIDGVFTGVGSVLSFLPIIVVLFFFLSMLEDTGYMARVAFVMDKLLRRIGLSGRSIVPMLIGFGCTVPGVMASRTLPSERDRKMTILLTPFMSCSAKLPIYSLFAAAFFPQYAGLVMVLLYFTGIAVGVLAALLLKSTVFKGEAVPFVMELPNYRLPGLKNVAQLLWEKARDFLQKAFTVIFAATIVIWFLQNFDLQLRLTADPQASILARIAGDIAPLFGPLGFADWRISTALITGFMAKESVVSSLLILFGSEAALSAALTPAQAAPLLVFCLLYTPCIAAVASVKRELGNKWAVIMVVNQCAVAWLCALLVRLAAVALF